MYSIGYSWQLALISILMFFIMFILANPQATFNAPQRNNVKGKIVLFFLIFSISNVFAFWEYDTYHYWEDFIMANFAGEIEHYEEFYNWLARECNNNYFLWRICIWLPATWFMYKTAERLDLLNRNLLLSIILFGSMLSLTRAMLGHTMLLFALVLLIDKKSSSCIKIVALVLFCFSYFLHKSMFVNIAFAILAFVPLNKRLIQVSWSVFPFLITISTILISSIVSGSLDTSFGEGVGGSGDRTVDYASAEKIGLNVKGIIGEFIRVIPQYLALFYVMNRIMFKHYLYGSASKWLYEYLFRLSYIAFYVASLFIFVETSSWIYTRLKYMGLFPLVFVLAKIWTLEPRTNKWIKWIIITQLFSMAFDLSYRIYSWS